ncbi:hypothetical protein BDM02DRAFT_3128105 [Thelephora ganbajun]|uniref:Uncharacterized protein n=1 Tax=Thelephora ganbajun TaxID=370292 RepID=A0ACB6ZJN2_THEGA|nr:hypothetical protein BDM02DRAFT_3128105 [Thelephora ganbajun]
MSDSHPGSELSIEQLVHALIRAVDPGSPSARRLLESGLQKILDVERSLHEVTRATRTIGNMLTPVNRFPPEILSRVLERRTREWDLITATHVCRYWRYTLTSNPSLWTCFQFQPSHDLNRTLTYLERSQSMPIDVNQDMRSPQALEMLKCFAPHIARVRSFVIRGPVNKDTILHLLRKPTPSLRHLAICFRGNSLARLPDDFLGRQAPSLRSVYFDGICPTFESPFPLPSLTQFNLHLPSSAGPFRMSALFRFFASCPWLQKVSIYASNEMSQDVTLDQVILLESLTELDYTSEPASRILPYLRLPRLNRLRVRLSSEPTQKLADMLPCDGQVLLAGVTKMSYRHDRYSQRIKLSGDGVDVSLTVFSLMGPIPVDWLSDGTYIPFGKIEDLTVEGSSNIAADFLISVFENLRVLRVTPRDTQFAQKIFRLLHPGTGIPCPFLREIHYTYSEPLDPLINLVQARLQAGYRLEPVLLAIPPEYDWDDEAELRRLVAEVFVQEKGI